MVLSGDIKRIIASIELASKHKNSKIFFTGGNSFLIKKDSLNETNRAKEVYKNLNFNLDRITFLGSSRNTIENFEEIKTLNLENKNTVLITSAFHMKRSILIGKKFDILFIPYAVDFRSQVGDNLINRYQKFNISSNLNQFDIFFREIIAIVIFKIFY